MKDLLNKKYKFHLLPPVVQIKPSTTYLFVCLLEYLVVMGVVCLFKSDSEQYSNQSKGKMIASYFKLSKTNLAYGRH